MESRNFRGGISFTGLLTVAFVVLKLCGAIDWAWLWVVSPLWIGIVFIIARTAIGVLFYTIADIISRF